MAQAFRGDPQSGLGRPILRHITPYDNLTRRGMENDPREWENRDINSSLMRYLLVGEDVEPGQDNDQFLMQRVFKTPQSRVDDYKDIMNSLPGPLGTVHDPETGPIQDRSEQDIYMNQLRRMIRPPPRYQTPLPNKGQPEFNQESMLDFILRGLS